MPENPLANDVWQALDRLRRALNDGYWDIADQSQADRILALAQDVDSIQDDMDRDEIMSNTAAYQQLKRRIDSVNAKLDRLKANLAQLITSVETVNRIVGCIDAATTLAAKFFV
jgi:uncharacterized protein YukE